MSIFNSKVDSESNQFTQNSDDMLNLIKQRKDILDRAGEKSDEKKPRFQARGQLTPRQRLDALIDPDSEFLDLYSMANYLVQDPDPDTSIPGANMIAGIGFVSDVRCMILVDDFFKIFIWMNPWIIDMGFKKGIEKYINSIR